MTVVRVIFVLVGLFGLFLLIASLTSLGSGGGVTVPGLGRQMGGTFLTIVGLIITGGTALLFFRAGRRR